MTEGGLTLKTELLTLNVTCPSYATVAESLVADGHAANYE